MAIDLSNHETVVVVGLGGVGSIVARYVAAFLDHLPTEHKLRLVDGDAYEHANKERQLFGRLGNKAEVTAEEIERYADLLVVPMTEYIGPENVDVVVQEGDLVLCCVDHHGVRRFVAERCADLDNVVLISGGNDGVAPDGTGGTYGNVQIHVRRDGEDVTERITKHHPEIAEASLDDAPLGDQGCSKEIESVPQLLFTNLQVAAAMCGALLAYATGQLRHVEAAFDVVEATMTPRRITV